MRNGSRSRRSNPLMRQTEKAPSPNAGGAFVMPEILAPHLRLACVGNDLLELVHAEHARHAVLADNERRRAAEFEGKRLIVVARQGGINRLAVGGEILVEAIHVGACTG